MFWADKLFVVVVAVVVVVCVTQMNTNCPSSSRQLPPCDGAQFHVLLALRETFQTLFQYVFPFLPVCNRNGNCCGGLTQTLPPFLSLPVPDGMTDDLFAKLHLPLTAPSVGCFFFLSFVFGRRGECSPPLSRGELTGGMTT